MGCMGCRAGCAYVERRAGAVMNLKVEACGFPGLHQSGWPTVLKLACICGANSFTLRMNRARAHQNGEPKWTETVLGFMGWWLG